MALDELSAVYAGYAGPYSVLAEDSELPRQTADVGHATTECPEGKVIREKGLAVTVLEDRMQPATLRRLQEEHSLALLLITHNLPLVRSLAQRVVVLCADPVVEHGSTTQVPENPRAGCTKRLIDDLPRFSTSGGAGLTRLNEDAW